MSPFMQSLVNWGYVKVAEQSGRLWTRVMQIHAAWCSWSWSAGGTSCCIVASWYLRMDVVMRLEVILKRLLKVRP